MKFNNAYQLTKEAVIKNVYQMPRANSYLASFSKFVSDIRQTEYAQNLLKVLFQEFIDTNIKSYPQYTKFKCHFVGSIAFIFADELNLVCEENGVHVGKIIRQPINDLLDFMIKRN